MSKPANQGRLSASDRTALIELYQDTDGSNWTKSENWATDTPIDEWYGVSTDSSGCVIELSLPNNRLQGHFPVSLAHLANLRLLDLSGNRLYGEIPAELSRLDALEMLVISDNPLSGHIPTELRGIPDSDLDQLGLLYFDNTGPKSSQTNQDVQSIVPEHLRGLDKHQLMAAQHVDGPLLILAGPGSGKTRVIAHRVANLVALGVAPENILAVTFTRKADREMRDRIDDLVKSTVVPATGRVNIGTFHSQALRILRREIRYLNRGLSLPAYTGRRQMDLIKKSMRQANISQKQFNPTDIREEIARAKDDLKTPNTYAKQTTNEFEKVVAKVYRRYQRMLEKANGVDYADMLGLCVRLFREFPSVRASYIEQFHFILVDEFQDINRAQYEFIRELGATRHNVCVVGDDDQNIYSWRGADVAFIRKFKTQFPEATIVRLERNYRSTKKIVDCANAVISRATDRIDKAIWTGREDGDSPAVIEVYNELEEAEANSGVIKDLLNEGFTYRDFAVIYRTNAQSRPLEVEFVQERLPYKLVKAEGFYARPEVRHVLSYLRNMVNPCDLSSFEYVANTRSSLTPNILQAFRQQALRTGCQPGELVRQLPTGIKAIDLVKDPAAEGELTQIGRMLCRMDELAKEEVVSRLVDSVVQESGYAEVLDNDPTGERWECIHELRNAATKHDPLGPGSSLVQFLKEADFVSSVATSSGSHDTITLVTAHSAKGLQFPVVIIIGLEEELFPHIRNLNDPVKLDEERRLAYVAITRAKERLFLSYSRYRSGKDLRNPSRFLQDIPQELLNYRRRIGPPQSSDSQQVDGSNAWSIDSDNTPPSDVGKPSLASTLLSTMPDRIALVALYQATNGPSWTNNRNWLSYAPLGQWHGVTTDDNGKVVRLDLSWNRLRGEIPSDLGSLINLEELHLKGNYLAGKIPAELTRLKNLTHLHVSMNRWSGWIPQELQDIPDNDLSQLGLPFGDS